MKRVVIVESVLVFALGVLAGVTLALFRPGPEPVIIRETATVNRYVHDMPGDYAGMVEAWNSPLSITGAMSGNWINVTVTDGYKEAQKGFRIAVPAPHNMITGGVYGRIDRGGVNPGAWCMYYRFISRAGIGAGCMVDPSGIGIMVGGAWTW